MRFLNGYLRILAVLALITPLLYLLDLSSPYIFTQVTFFQIVVELALVPLAALWLYDKESRPRASYNLFIASAFMGSLVLFNIFSQQPLKSFAGTWERFGDVIDYAHLYVYFLLLVSLYRSRAEWLRFFCSAALVGTAVTLYGLAQHFSLFHVFTQGSRVFSTLGNPAFLSSYLLLSCGITWFVASAGGRRRWLYAALVAGAVILFLTFTRAGILGFLLSVLIIAFSAFLAWGKAAPGIAGPSAVRLRLFFSILLILIVPAGLMIIPRAERSRLLALTTENQTVQARVLQWRSALKGFRERPVVGWGEGNYSIVAARYFEPEQYRGTGQSSFFDRSHNEFLDRAVATGAVGLLLYSALLAAPVFVLWRRRDRSDRILASFLVGYYVYLFFFFHSIGDTILFFSIFAYTQWRGSRVREMPLSGIRSVAFPYAIILSVGLAFVLHVQDIVANYTVRQGELTDTIPRKIVLFARARPLSDMGKRAIVQNLARALASAQEVGAGSRNADELLFRWATDALTVYPYDLDLYFIAVQAARDARRFDEAIRLLAAMKSLSPDNPQVYEAFGLVFLDRAQWAGAGGLREALLYFQRAQALAPGVRELTMLVVGTQGMIDRTDKPLRSILEAEHASFGPEEWEFMVELLYVQGSREGLRRSYELLQALPRDGGAYEGLSGYARYLIDALSGPVVSHKHFQYNNRELRKLVSFILAKNETEVF